MTQSTEQERELKGIEQALRLTREAHQHEVDAYRQELYKPEGDRKPKDQLHRLGDLICLVQNILHAAQQAARRAQLDDIGVVDMAQAVDSKEAAHVQLPEAEDGPSSCAYCGQPSDEPRKPLSDAAIRDLYSEEVCWDMVAPYVIAFARSIEAAHGIQEQST